MAHRVEFLRADGADLSSTPTVGVIRDDGVLVVRGVVFSDAPVMHRINGEPADLSVTFDESTVRRIRKRGNGGRSTLINHGNSGDLFVDVRSNVGQVIGKMHDFRAEKRRSVNVITAEFLLDPALAIDERGRDLIGPIHRGVLEPLSAGFSTKAGSLTLVSEATRTKRAQYTAKLEDIGEGSVVGLQADLHSGFSRSKEEPHMPPELRTDKDNPADMQRQIDAAVKAAITQERAAQTAAEQEQRAAIEAAERRKRFNDMVVDAAGTFGMERATDMRERADGDPDSLAQLIRMADAAGEAKKPGRIPTPTGVPGATGGTPNAGKALRDMQIMVLARGLPKNDRKRQEYIAEAAKRGIDINRPAIGFLTDAARSLGIETEGYTNDGRLAIVETLRKRSAAAGGLGPDELPEVYRDTVNLAIEAGHSRVMMPESLMGNRVQLDDFRKTYVARWDVAANWKPLSTSAELSIFKTIDAGFFLEADQYGGLLRIDDRAIANDRVGVLAQLPNLIGAYVAEQETRIWVERLVAGYQSNGYQGIYKVEVADPLAFAAFIQGIKIAAIGTVPVADENKQLKSSEPQSVTMDMVPTAIHYGVAAEQAWLEYATPILTTVGAGETRSEVIRTPFVQTLYENRFELLHLGTTTPNTYYRPLGPQDPMAWGRVSGRERRVTIAEAPVDRVSGQAIKLETTWVVDYVKNTGFEVSQAPPP
jgi:hypothetical protein